MRRRVLGFVMALVLVFTGALFIGPESFESKAAGTTLSYNIYMQKFGWGDRLGNGEAAYTYLDNKGNSMRLEGFTVKLSNPSTTGSITYKAYVQGIGWQNWVKDGSYAGTKGKSKRVEAVQIKLTGKLANVYDIYYRTSVQGYGWLAWTKNGATSGTMGYAKKIEGIQIKLVAKGSGVPKDNIVSSRSESSIAKPKENNGKEKTANDDSTKEDTTKEDKGNNEYEDVYVIDKTETVLYDVSGEMINSSESYYYYNSVGLLTKEETGTSYCEFYYSSDNMLITTKTSDPLVTKYVNDSKGRRIESTTDGWIVKHEYSYGDDGWVSSEIRTDYDTGKKTYYYYVRNKKGLITKQVIKKENNHYEYTYDYDDYGNYKDYTIKKAIYKDGRLTEWIKNGGHSFEGDTHTKFIYKKIKVKKSNTDLIKKQQWSIINRNYTYYSNSCPDSYLVYREIK